MCNFNNKFREIIILQKSSRWKEIININLTRCFRPVPIRSNRITIGWPGWDRRCSSNRYVIKALISSISSWPLMIVRNAKYTIQREENVIEEMIILYYILDYCWYHDFYNRLHVVQSNQLENYFERYLSKENNLFSINLNNLKASITINIIFLSPVHWFIKILKCSCLIKCRTILSMTYKHESIFIFFIKTLNITFIIFITFFNGF